MTQSGPFPLSRNRRGDCDADRVRRRVRYLEGCGSVAPFEITEPTRDALAVWLKARGRRNDDWLFPSRSRPGDHVYTRQYARQVDKWASMIELEARAYGTRGLRRTKVALIYKKIGNLRACQLLLGHKKLESTVRYFDIEVDDALKMPEQIDL